jgi:hypothetical protein
MLLVCVKVLVSLLFSDKASKYLVVSWETKISLLVDFRNRFLSSLNFLDAAYSEEFSLYHLSERRASGNLQAVVYLSCFTLKISSETRMPIPMTLVTGNKITINSYHLSFDLFLGNRFWVKIREEKKKIRTALSSPYVFEVIAVIVRKVKSGDLS